METTEKGLARIPSELIEPYITEYIGSIIEAVGIGMKSPEDASNDIKGLDRFVSYTCGIHARLAMDNFRFDNVQYPDQIERFKEICIDVVKSI